MHLLIRKSKGLNFKINNNTIQSFIDLFIVFLLGITLLFFKDNTKIITIVSILILFLTIFSKLENNLYYMFFFLPYYMFLLIKGFQFYNLLLIAFCIKYFLKNINRLKIEIFLLPFFLLLIEIINSFDTGITSEMIKWIITSLVFSILLFDPIKTIQIKKCIYFFALSMFLLSISVIFFNSNEVIDDDLRNLITGIAFIEKNTYSIYGCVALMAILYLLKYEFKKNAILLVPFVLILVSSVMMISKTFLLIFSVSLILFLRFAIKTGKSLMLCILIFLIALVLIVSNEYMLGLVHSYIHRFEKAENFNELTTGRWEIFLEYGEYLFSHPLCLLFGEGLFSYMSIVNNSFILKLRPHNLELELLMAWGIIGTLIVVLLVKDYYRHSKIKLKPKKNNIAVLPFFSLMFGLQAITLIYQNITMMIFIFCFYLMLFNQYEEKKIYERKM